MTATYARTYKEAIDYMVETKRLNRNVYGPKYYLDGDPESGAYKAHTEEVHRMDTIAFVYGVDYAEVSHDVAEEYGRKYDIFDI